MTYGPFPSEGASEAGVMKSSILSFAPSPQEMIEQRHASVTIPAFDGSVQPASLEGGPQEVDRVHKAQSLIDDLVAKEACKPSFLITLPTFFLSKTFVLFLLVS
jgi:hypothetical protein